MFPALGAFVSLNLFVGAIVDNFTRIKQESDGSATMTAGQQQWVQAMSGAMRSKAMRTIKKPTAWVRRLFALVNSQPFEVFIMGVIICNVFTMAIDYYGMEADTAFYRKYNLAMTAFNYIYYVEATLKITAFGLGYFRDAWCQFDFFLVSTSLLDQFFAELLRAYLPIPPMVLRCATFAPPPPFGVSSPAIPSAHAIRVACANLIHRPARAPQSAPGLRVLRILRLLKGAKGVRDLLMTLVLSFPALVNVFGLLALCMFIYSILGVQLFTFVMRGDNLTDDRNFDTFGQAALLLFQVITGDGWSGLMEDCMVDQARGCDPAEGNCGSWVALPSF